MIERRLVVLCALLLAFAGDAARGEEEGWDGMVSLRWNLLTQSNGIGADYLDMLGRLRLETPQMGARNARFGLELDGRRGWEERFAPEGERYESRSRVRRLGGEVDLAGGRLHLGRHLPLLGGTGVGDADGVSWERRGRAWSVGLTGGYQVPFWEPNTPFSGDRFQAGGTLGWRPVAGHWEVASALSREEAVDGTERWRAALDGRWRAGRWNQGTHVETDLSAGEWLYWRVDGGWRPGRSGSIRISYAGRKAALFPLRVGADSLLYGGRIHTVSGWFNYRRTRGLTATLQLRSTYGDRQYRSETLQLHSRGWLPAGWSLGLRLHDSWSDWRQLERLGLELEGRWGRQLRFSTGADATLFRWEESRDPTWRVRARPRLRLRYMPGGSWSWELTAEETLDEFQHLRTRVSAGGVYRL